MAGKRQGVIVANFQWKKLKGKVCKELFTVTRSRRVTSWHLAMRPLVSPLSPLSALCRQPGWQWQWKWQWLAMCSHSSQPAASDCIPGAARLGPLGYGRSQNILMGIIHRKPGSRHTGSCSNDRWCTATRVRAEDNKKDNCLNWQREQGDYFLLWRA